MAEFQVDKKRVAKNTIVLYTRMAFTMVISFIAARVTLQQLGVDDYGLNNLVGGVVAFLGFFNTSIGTAIQRFYSIEIGKGKEGQLMRVFRTGLYLHILIAIFTVLLLEVFAIFFLHKMNIPDNRMYAAQVVLQISTIQFAVNILSVPYAAMLRAREYFDKIAILDIIQALLRLGVLYLLIHIYYDKLITLTYLNLIVSLLYTAGILILSWRLPEVHAWPQRDKEIMRRLFSFVSMLILSTLAALGRKQGLVMLINLFFGLAVNAAYAIAIQVSHIIDTFVQNFKQAMVPQMVSSYGAGDLPTMHRFINFGTKISSLLMLFISFPLIFESQFLLTIWLKTPPEYAANLVALVIININISQLTYFHYQGVQATGNITLNQTLLTILYSISLVFYYIAFKLGASFYSALYINFFISGLVVTNGLMFSHRLYDYNVGAFIKQILSPILLISIIIAVILFLICHIIEPSIGRAILVFTVSSISLLGLGYGVLLNKNERKRVLSFVKTIK